MTDGRGGSPRARNFEPTFAAAQAVVAAAATGVGFVGALPPSGQVEFHKVAETGDTGGNGGWGNK